MRTKFNNSFTIPLPDELRKCRSEIYHLTSNLLPHQLAKIECSTVQLYSPRYSMQMKCDGKSFLQYLSTELKSRDQDSTFQSISLFCATISHLRGSFQLLKTFQEPMSQTPELLILLGVHEETDSNIILSGKYLT